MSSNFSDELTADPSVAGSSATATPPELHFGTAGLRARVGSARNEMNVSSVTRATAGVAAWMRKHVRPSRLDERFTVAVGFDARYGSHAFARATAETFAGAGFEVTLISDPCPTPILAWLVKHRGFDAGVQITASHNPAADNGYKLYLDGGKQLLAPADAEIEAEIALQPEASHIRRLESKSMDLAAKNGYVAAISSLVATGEQAVLRPRRALRILYTPMHGVGGEALEAALVASGFGDIHTVPSQRWPDPEFPTVEFPNPEEPGATDLLLAEAERVQPDLLIALDPDADRCMLGVPDGDGFRMFRGDETGPLLARRVAGMTSGRKTVATTVVSSQLLSVMAQREGWEYVETLTGFKHLSRASANLTYAYEEAIGVCPAPHIVADKDGIATALIAATWAAELAACGRTLLDELLDLELTYGAFRTAQVSARFSTAAEAKNLIDTVLAEPPAQLAGCNVSAGHIADSAGQRTHGVRLDGKRDGLSLRVVARPSGTEPKAKFYLEASGPAERGAEVDDLLRQLVAEIEELSSRP